MLDVVFFGIIDLSVSFKKSLDTGLQELDLRYFSKNVGSGLSDKWIVGFFQKEPGYGFQESGFLALFKKSLDAVFQNHELLVSFRRFWIGAFRIGILGFFQ